MGPHTLSLSLLLFVVAVAVGEWFFYRLSSTHKLRKQSSRLGKNRLPFVLEKMGALDHVSNLFDCSGAGHSRRRQLQTVEIRIKMDCEGCERKVRRSVEGMKGVTEVEIDPRMHKLTVVGFVEPSKVVSRVRHRTGKKAELWPYVHYDEVAHPYAQGVYDRKAPAGYVRGGFDDPRTSQLARASSTEVRYTTAFSDDNPGACSVM